jgi:hypothetical protein
MVLQLVLLVLVAVQAVAVALWPSSHKALLMEL